MIKQITVIINIAVHEDGSRFYEWELKNVKKEELEKVFKMLKEDLRDSTMIPLSETKEPKEGT